MQVVRSRFLVSVATTTALALLAATTNAELPQAAKVQKGVKVQGHIVHVKGPNQVVVRTADNRDVILNVNPQTTYMLRDKAVVFTEVREGLPVQVVYDTRAVHWSVAYGI